MNGLKIILFSWSVYFYLFKIPYRVAYLQPFVQRINYFHFKRANFLFRFHFVSLSAYLENCCINRPFLDDFRVFKLSSEMQRCVQSSPDSGIVVGGVQLVFLLSFRVSLSLWGINLQHFMGFFLEHGSQTWPIMEIPKEMVRNKVQDPTSGIFNQNLWDGSGLGTILLKE